MTAEPVIQIKDLAKAFGAKKVLQGLDLQVKEGESVVVIGGSGTGKSVMLKCILGLLEADGGSIRLDGIELIGASRKTYEEARDKISMLFQGSALFDSLPVWENISFALLQKGLVSRKEGKELAVKLLGQVGLPPEAADLSPSELSGGMQRRVALARALASKPRIIFFDEPTAGLDPIISGVISELIRKCVKDLGVTAITITHDMKCAAHVGDRIAMLYDGKIVWQGTPDEMKNSTNPYIKQFVHGESEGPIRLQVRA